ncbi:hypothetical protein ACGFIW_08145 [Micromonospora sp. NPDC048935]|uniref:hypothetical protein n=1 Tax=Micromonospora sp. NPDC048935 TaxID=3364262 RepID=UPI003712B5BF
MLGNGRRIRRGHRLGLAALLVSVLVVVSSGQPVYAANLGSEPTLPYAQPSNANLPRAGCDTTATDPKNPPVDSPAALQVIYAWNDSTGNQYSTNVEHAARVMDRVDWLLDQASNYDQHFKFSCRSTTTSTYNQYAQAIVTPEKIDTPNTDYWSIANELTAKGYDDSNRWYVLLTEFAAPSASAYWCPTSGGGGCVSIVEVWDSGVVGHEVTHLLGAGHAYMSENVWQDSNGNWQFEQYCPDITMCWSDWWAYDMGYRQNYDPSETSASFYVDNYPSTTTRNTAVHPLLTSPVCCDVGANNDLLTAQERTIEAQAPGTSNPTGFSTAGSGAAISVTPQGSFTGLSARYFDNRRSLQFVSSPQSAEKSVLVSRKPSVTVGHNYKFYVRLRANSGTAALRMRWYNSGGTLLSTSTSSSFGLTSNWLEWSHEAVAPSNAATVQISVVAPSGGSQPATLTMNVDTLQLTDCSANENSLCRPTT